MRVELQPQTPKFFSKHYSTPLCLLWLVQRKDRFTAAPFCDSGLHMKRLRVTRERLCHFEKQQVAG